MISLSRVYNGRMRFTLALFVPIAALAQTASFKRHSAAIGLCRKHKGQVRWLAKDDVVGQVKFIESLFGIAA
jgi:hypothetical protein